MTRHDPDQEGRRSVAITMTNAAFSKLIKLGQAKRKTPVEMARELFEEAYAARCLGKIAPAVVQQQQTAADALMTEKTGELVAQMRAERDELRQKLEGARQRTSELERDKFQLQEHASHQGETIEQVSREVGRLTADLAEARRERDELSRRCWNAEGELERLRAVPAEVEAAAQAAIAELADEPLPELEPAQPAIGRGTVKAVLAMHSLRATPAEIAKDLALRREVVDQVLAEARA
jgi:chromosome segregation ATPase